jgi:molybdate transport system substrate-binding protein
VPAANEAGIGSPRDLARDGLRIVAAGDDVPITTYARRAVDNLAGLPGYPADFAARYASNIASREDNASAIVAKIELGEGDAGIVYATDARTADNVSIVAIPAEANVPATYAGVVVKTTRHIDAAADFLDWLVRPEGHAILAELGFLRPDE